MVIEIPETLAAALTAQANAQGMSAEEYARELLVANVPASNAKLQEGSSKQPMKSGRGLWAKYGFTLSEAEIDRNRAEMFRDFGESL